jgi:hypothetical protein
MIIKLVMLCIGINNKVNIHTITFKVMYVVVVDAEVVVDAVAVAAAADVVVAEAVLDVLVALIAGTGGLFKYSTSLIFHMKERCKYCLYFSFML